jgi:hypothetical protein
MRTSFLFQEIHWTRNPIWRIGFNYPNAEFGQAYVRSFLRIEYGRSRNLELAGSVGFGFARSFAKPLGQLSQFLFPDGLIELHALKVNNN